MDALAIEQWYQAVLNKELGDWMDRGLYEAATGYGDKCRAILKAHHDLNNLNNKSGANPPSNADGSL